MLKANNLMILFILVTIRATSGTFRGFFLQARSAVDTSNTIAYGEFFNFPSGTMAVTCDQVSGNYKFLGITRILCT